MSPSPTLSCARSFSRSYSCSLCVCMVYLELFATGLVRQFKANDTIVVAPQKLDLHPHAPTHRGTRTRAHHHRVRKNFHILSCVYTCACAFVFSCRSCAGACKCGETSLGPAARESFSRSVTSFRTTSPPTVSQVSSRSWSRSRALEPATSSSNSASAQHKDLLHSSRKET